MIVAVMWQVGIAIQIESKLRLMLLDTLKLGH